MRQRIDWISFGLGAGLALAALLTVTGWVQLWQHTDEAVPGVLRTELLGPEILS